MLSATSPYRFQMENGLVLRSVADRWDLERVAAFNGLIHGEGVAAMTRELLLHHPSTRPEHWLYVEDQAAARVVSSLCLIPWTWRYEDVQLRAGEMGIAGTLEAYRHRGLVRAQAARHAEMLREGGYDLGHIQGIPYFYRQFGYEYAIPLEGGWRVEPHLIPDRPGCADPSASCRLATTRDLPALVHMYDRAAADLRISTVRDEATWRYLLGPSLRTEMTAETWLVQDAAGAPLAYLRIPQHGFGRGLIVNEVSCLSGDAAEVVLSHVKALALKRDKPYVRLSLPSESALVQAARRRGAHDLGTYAWQIHLVDVAGLLRKLAPVYERRIAASPFADSTQNVCLNLYRRAFELRFERGRLACVAPLGFSNRGGLRIPPLLAAPLLLGYRDMGELMDAHHDVSVAAESRYLLDVLFPKLQSFIYTIY